MKNIFTVLLGLTISLWMNRDASACAPGQCGVQATYTVSAARQYIGLPDDAVAYCITQPSEGVIPSPAGYMQRCMAYSVIGNTNGVHWYECDFAGVLVDGAFWVDATPSRLYIPEGNAGPMFWTAATTTYATRIEPRYWTWEVSILGATIRCGTRYIGYDINQAGCSLFLPGGLGLTCGWDSFNGLWCSDIHPMTP